MPRPVSDAVADGLPLWDTYEALFFLLTGIFLGLVLGFLFPSAWRSFRRSFRRIDKYRPDKSGISGQLKFSSKNQLLPLSHSDESEEEPVDVDLVSLFVAARYAVQDNSFRDAAQLYLQILGSEKVTRVQTNKAMYELAQVYSLSGLTERAIETALELLHRKPAHTDVLRLLLSLCSQQPSVRTLTNVVDTYAGPKSGELAREVSHQLSEAALSALSSDVPLDAVSLAKLAVRWSPAALEPKLALVIVTSVISRRKNDLPLDQSVLGFFVDLAELVRLYRLHPVQSPFFRLSLFSSWSKFFDEHDAEVEQVLEKLKTECLAQLDWNASEKDSAFRSGLSFLIQAFFKARNNPSSESRWVTSLSRLLGMEPESSNPLTVFNCPDCLGLQREFRWKCPTCLRWDTLVPWQPSQPSQ